MISVENYSGLDGVAENGALVTDPGISGYFMRLVTPVTADGGVVVQSSSDQWQRVFTGAINPRWWGAVGDGTTSDTAAFQSAIDYAGTHGKRIEVNPGTYLIDNTLNCGSLQGLHLTGMKKRANGKGVEIIADTDTLLSFSSSSTDHSHTVIENLSFRALPTTGAEQNCILLEDCVANFFSLRNLDFVDFKGYALKTAGTFKGDNMLLERLKFVNCGGVKVNGDPINTLTARQIEVEIGIISDQLPVLLDLGLADQVKFDGLFVTGNNTNSSLVILKSKGNSHYSRTLSRIETTAPHCFFQLGDTYDPNTTDNTVNAIVTIENFSLEQEEDQNSMIEVNNNDLVKIIDFQYFFAVKLQDIVNVANPRAKVTIDGVMTLRNFSLFPSDFPAVKVENVHVAYTGRSGPLYSQFEDVVLFEWNGEGPLVGKKSKHVTVSHFNSPTDSNYELDAEEGRIQKFTTTDGTSPQHRIQVSNLPDYMVGGQVIVAIRYNVEALQGAVRSFALYQNFNLSSYILSHNAGANNQWVEAYQVVENIPANFYFRSQGISGHGVADSLKVSSVKVIYGKEVPKLLNIGSNQPVTFEAATLPSNSAASWIAGDQLYYTDPAAAGYLGAIYDGTAWVNYDAI